MQMNLQLHHVVADVTGVTGMRIIRAIVAGERDPAAMATHRDRPCKASAETLHEALVGNYRPEHVFALTQALELYDFYQQQVARCDERIERSLRELPPGSKHRPGPCLRHGASGPKPMSRDSTSEGLCTRCLAGISHRYMGWAPLWR